MGVLLKSKLPCTCGSSDAGHVYENEKGEQWFKCFSCGANKPVAGTEQYESKSRQTRKLTKVDDYLESKVADIEERSIDADTCMKYGVRESDRSYLFPFFNDENELQGIKFRKKAKKDFFFDGEVRGCGLFGQSAFPKGGKYITITEGEFDAMAAYEMMGSKYPVVSVKTGAEGALRDCKEAYDWLNSFEKIVVCFDADEPGQTAAKKIGELLGSKVKIVKLDSSLKDANAYLMEGAGNDFVATWWRAEAYTPDGIVAGSKLWDLVKVKPKGADCSYPFEGLNKLTYGIRLGELVTITAGSGLGKSQTVKEIAYHIHQHTENNIGLLLLEEDKQRSALSLMGLHLSKPIHLPDTEVTDEELKEAFDAMYSTDRVYFFDHFGSTSVDNIISRVRHMAKAMDCKYIILDHVSIIVSSQENGDERKALDEIMTKLRMLVQETGIALILISHLRRPEGKGHEEGAVTSLGQLRGSASIAQLSDIVIGLERNAQDEDATERNTTRYRVLKNRFSGLTGPAGAVLYSHTTGRLTEVEDEEL